MNYLEHHLAHHAPRGFGESPIDCPACPAVAARVAQIEARLAKTDSLLVRIGIAAGASVLAAYVVERYIRRR